MVCLARKTLAIFVLIFFASSGICAAKPITRDVVIIGGGSTGAYSALRLRDEGKSVVVIERESVLGGHTNTYVDEQTKTAVDYGVILLHNLPIVQQYFTRLNISWEVKNMSQIFPTITQYFDPDTAQPVNITPTDLSAALAAYSQLLSQYSYLETGYFLPNPVPEDLLLPYRFFIAKYPDIANATYLIAQYNEGFGDMLDQPTLYVLKVFGADVLQTIANGGLVPTSNNFHEIYDKVSKILGPDVLYSSTVVSTQQRDSKGVQINVNTPYGPKTIQAKKILITIPQTLVNFLPFDPDNTEAHVFGRFSSSGYYTSLVRGTGLASNFSSFSATSNTSFNISPMPRVYSIYPTAVNGVFGFRYGSAQILPDTYVQQKMLSYLKKLQENGFTGQFSQSASFLRFKNHVPFQLTAPIGSIASGFYDDLYALQGYRSTWYTGAAFHVHDSSRLWNFTETTVLPGLLKSL
ncbi:FAD/NAD(P)-binding domain-containing protein [Penicillium citrinum]|uniref:FAD/NAD(P)-binding domain-containing protein n=1 Tax=Penicillium citrinum TaxID=5077 RepID=A0A9W9PDA6_PENCI|nr:FAD/NAD(P)-binding domain-containing protein [Penicillium citrinum]KAJ5242450.1 FAD/NAD(P)-binding domain-containing protein [Penicillium citrinum]